MVTSGRILATGHSEEPWTASVRRNNIIFIWPTAAAKGTEARCLLQVLRGEEDLRELLDDDDEDEDFTLDWDELMGPDPFGQGNPSWPHSGSWLILLQEPCQAYSESGVHMATSLPCLDQCARWAPWTQAVAVGIVSLYSA